MNKYKSDDYKLSAVKYYLNTNDSLDKVCSIFDCKKSTLKGWVDNKDELRLIHGLLHCKNGCGSWNRDRNGSSNIYKIAKNAINNIDRPSYLCRETSNQSISTSAYNQTLRRYEKT